MKKTIFISTITLSFLLLTSTVLAQGIAFIAALLYLNSNHKIMKFALSKLKFDKDLFYKSLRIGLPSGLQHTFVAMGMMALLGIIITLIG